jgi:Zn-dependent peptidase ImmA (M78 family)
MQPRFSLARRKAQALLQTANVKRAPVNVEHLARLAGAEIEYEPFEGQISGLVHRHPSGSVTIGVNSAHPVTRQRFTVAHEIGHLLLHKDEELHVDERAPVRFRDEESSLATNSDEIEANQFASELLMPTHLVREEIKKLPKDIDAEHAVSMLAERFQVSEQAAMLRLIRLGILS